MVVQPRAIGVFLRRVSALFLCMFVWSGCGSEGNDESTSDLWTDDGDAGIDAGETVVSGSSDASELAQLFGIASYTYEITLGEGALVDLWDEDGEQLGTVTLGTDETGVFFAAIEGDDIPDAGYVMNVQQVDSSPPLAIDITVFSGDDSMSISMLALDEGADFLQDIVVLAPYDEDDAPPSLGEIVLNGDDAFAQLQIVDQGAFPYTQEETLAWMAEVGLEGVMTNDGINMLGVLMSDELLRQAFETDLGGAFGFEAFSSSEEHGESSLKTLLQPIHTGQQCGLLFGVGSGVAAACCTACVPAAIAVLPTGGWAAVIAIPSCICCAAFGGVSMVQIFRCVRSKIQATTQADCDARERGSWETCTVNSAEHGCNCSCGVGDCASYLQNYPWRPSSRGNERVCCRHNNCESGRCLCTALAECGDNSVTATCPMSPAAVEDCDGAGRAQCDRSHECVDCECIDRCGNGVVNRPLGEECDPGSIPVPGGGFAQAQCSATHACEACACVNHCGNTFVETNLGEECDGPGQAQCAESQECRGCICEDVDPCSDGSCGDVGTDTGVADTGSDAGTPDTPDTGSDAGTPDTPDTGSDAGIPDTPDTGSDAGIPDTPDTGSDAGIPDTPDTGSDAGIPDTPDTGSDASILDTPDTGSDASILDTPDTGSDAGIADTPDTDTPDTTDAPDMPDMLDDAPDIDDVDMIDTPTDVFDAGGADAADAGEDLMCGYDEFDVWFACPDGYICSAGGCVIDPG